MATHKITGVRHTALVITMDGLPEANRRPVCSAVHIPALTHWVTHRTLKLMLFVRAAREYGVHYRVNVGSIATLPTVACTMMHWPSHCDGHTRRREAAASLTRCLSSDCHEYKATDVKPCSVTMMDLLYGESERERKSHTFQFVLL